MDEQEGCPRSLMEVTVSRYSMHWGALVQWVAAANGGDTIRSRLPSASVDFSRKAGYFLGGSRAALLPQVASFWLPLEPKFSVILFSMKDYRTCLDEILTTLENVAAFFVFRLFFFVPGTSECSYNFVSLLTLFGIQPCRRATLCAGPELRQI